MVIETYYPLYLASHALIIGINKYQHASPLGYAINDAEIIASLLINEFDFDKDNVVLLTDEKATRNNIMKSVITDIMPGDS